MRAHNLPPLLALRAFEAVARQSSFTKAAAELAVTPTAISHHIRQLETYLGCRVLDRSPRSVALTAEGAALYDVAHASLASIQAVTAQLRHGCGPFRTTLSSTTAFLGCWLVPRLASLRREMPALDLRLHASDAPVELRTGGIEVAIRYGTGPYPDGVALCEDRFAAVCSPSLGIRTLEDLQGATLLHLDGLLRPKPAPTWRLWCAQAKLSGIEYAAGPRFPDSQLAIQAAIAGQGVLIVSRLLVSTALDSGLLISPFAYTLPGDSYHFVCSGKVAGRPDILKLRNWFRQALTATA
jgi:LysR family transcriptional regulator, glycine cleavage system transcriptional activator